MYRGLSRPPKLRVLDDSYQVRSDALLLVLFFQGDAVPSLFEGRSSIVCHLITGSKAVAERSVGLRRCAVRHAGGIGSANAGMSSEKECERHSRRKSKVSSARLIRRG